MLSVLSGGARTVPQVARRLGVTRQSVQRVANLLAAEGLIDSAPNPDNARSPLFRLSERGEEVLTAITRAADPRLRRVGEELSLEDLRRVRAALAVLMHFARGGNRPLRRAPATLLDVFAVHWFNGKATDCMQQNLATLRSNAP